MKLKVLATVYRSRVQTAATVTLEWVVIKHQEITIADQKVPPITASRSSRCIGLLAARNRTVGIVANSE